MHFIRWIILLISRKMFDIYLGIFIIIAILVIAGGTYQFYGMGQTYGAALFFAGSLYIFIIYGIRWFGPTPLFRPASGPWPPIINTCPDYLTYYQRTVDGVKKDTCIDLVGVSKGEALPKYVEGKAVSTSYNPFFDLTTTSSDPVKKNQELCKKAMDAGLTWEGITNGDGCISVDGKVTGAGSAAAGTC